MKSLNQWLLSNVNTLQETLRTASLQPGEHSIAEQLIDLLRKLEKESRSSSLIGELSLYHLLSPKAYHPNSFHFDNNHQLPHNTHQIAQTEDSHQFTSVDNGHQTIYTDGSHQIIEVDNVHQTDPVDGTHLITHDENTHETTPDDSHLAVRANDNYQFTHANLNHQITHPDDNRQINQNNEVITTQSTPASHREPSVISSQDTVIQSDVTPNTVFDEVNHAISDQLQYRDTITTSDLDIKTSRYYSSCAADEQISKKNQESSHERISSLRAVPIDESILSELLNVQTASEASNFWNDRSQSCESLPDYLRFIARSTDARRELSHRLHCACISYLCPTRHGVKNQFHSLQDSEKKRIWRLRTSGWYFRYNAANLCTSLPMSTTGETKHSERETDTLGMNPEANVAFKLLVNALLQSLPFASSQQIDDSFLRDPAVSSPEMPLRSEFWMEDEITSTTVLEVMPDMRLDEDLFMNESETSLTTDFLSNIDHSLEAMPLTSSFWTDFLNNDNEIFAFVAN